MGSRDDTETLLNVPGSDTRDNIHYGSVLIRPGAGATGKHIQKTDVQIKVYKRRWYIMVVYGLMSMTQCAVWNTFSPISDVAERVFDWDDSTLSLLTNWGPIAYLIGTPLFSWIIDEKGLRPACLLSAFLVAAGTGLRCITSQTLIATPLIHIGQLLNGLAGPIAMGAPPAVSAEWFPPEQRTTATAIATLFNTMGLAVSFLLGPYLVPDTKVSSVPESKISPTVTRATSGILSEHYMYNNVMEITTVQPDNSTSDPGYDIGMDRHNIMMYMYYSCGMAVLCLLLFFTYFPSKPPQPPSPTASIKRLNFKTGLKKLASNRSFWLICLTYGLPLGIQGCWQGVLDVNLKSHDISQTTAAWLGFWGIIAGVAASLIVARCADIFARHMKWFLSSLFIVGGCSYLVFAFALVSLVPGGSVVIYTTYLIGSICLGACTPLFFESACEVTYPVAEGVTTLVLTLVNNIAGLLFLAVPMIPNLGTMWENWSLVGGILICVPVLLLMRQDYNRLDIDLEVEEENNGDNSGMQN